MGLFFLVDVNGNRANDDDPVRSDDPGGSNDEHFQQYRRSKAKSRAMQAATCEERVEGKTSTGERKPTAADGTIGWRGISGRRVTMVGWRTLPPANEVRD